MLADSALSATLLGKNAGPELATLLASGSEGINELAGQAQVLSQEQLDTASEFQDRMGEVKNQIDALVSSLGADLMPTIIEWIEAAQEWFERNEDIIKQDFAASIKFVVEVVKILGETASATVENLSALLEGVGGWWKRGEAISKPFSMRSSGCSSKPLVRSRTSRLCWPSSGTCSRTSGSSPRTRRTSSLRSMGQNRDVKHSNGSRCDTGRIARPTRCGGSTRRWMRSSARVATTSRSLGTRRIPPKPNFNDYPVGSKQYQKDLKAWKAKRDRILAEHKKRHSTTKTKPQPKPKEEDKPEPKKPELKPITLEDLRRQLLSGNLAAMHENLRAISSPAGAAAQTKPSVVITYNVDNSTTVNIDGMKVEHINASVMDPASVAGQAVAQAARQALKRELHKTAKRIPNTVKR